MTEAWVGYLTGPWGFAFAFAAGVLSFLSPCVLPLVPAYIAHLTGTAATLEPGRSDRRETVSHAAVFMLGFTAVFTIVGGSVGAIAAVFSADNQYAVRDALPMLQKVGAVALIVMGLNLMGVIRLPFLYRTYSFETMMTGPMAAGAGAGGGTIAVGGGSRPSFYGLNYLKSFGIGSSFALGWTPCIGPVLGAILTLSATTGDAAQGSYLLLVYSLGLGVPFIITALAVAPMTRFLRRIRGIMPVVEIVTGVMIIGVGVLLFFNELTIFNSWFSKIPGIKQFNQI
jgi:cytochrome c-type biogenesis protein